VGRTDRVSTEVAAGVAIHRGLFASRRVDRRGCWWSNGSVDHQLVRGSSRGVRKSSNASSARPPGSAAQRPLLDGPGERMTLAVAIGPPGAVHGLNTVGSDAESVRRNRRRPEEARDRSPSEARRVVPRHRLPGVVAGELVVTADSVR
jgi:hypothetical protein